jgi:hypothetical protein
MSVIDMKTRGQVGPERVGGGGEGSGIEGRIAKLESSVEHIESDVKEIKDDLRTLLKGGIAAFVLTWAGLIASALGLAYLMAKGFKWL